VAARKRAGGNRAPRARRPARGPGAPGAQVRGGLREVGCGEGGSEGAGAALSSGPRCAMGAAVGEPPTGAAVWGPGSRCLKFPWSPPSTA
jgi:hypothetical protein